MPETLIVLYQISNSKESSGLYNAFQMNRDYTTDGSGAVTLAAVKRHCIALRSLNHAGPDGYHWRVRVDDRAASSSSNPSFSWWDIQDENARLPIKENVSMTEVERLYMAGGGGGSSSSVSSAVSDDPATHVKGALRSLGKAMKEVTSGGSGGGGEFDNAPRVNVIAFKLLDMVKSMDEFKSGGRSMAKTKKKTKTRPASAPPAAAPSRSQPTPPPRSAPRRTTPQRPAATTPPHQRHPATTAKRPIPRVAPPKSRSTPATAAPPPAAPEKPLMDFGSAAPTPSSRSYHHSASSPPNFSSETRAEKLKREYKQKQQTQNRVWDDVDQRWVAVDASHGTIKRGTTAAPPSAANATKKKEVGIKLDPSNAVGKSATVQAAVHQRVNDMKTAQVNAVRELKQREISKKKEEDEEDAVRKRIEPKIKAWSEEHGKKKQLRALLASLHLILWRESGWKPVNLGDILDEKKARRCYLKATLKVHPDKTKGLDAEKRFIAKRVFDALSQAMTEFENKKG